MSGPAAAPSVDVVIDDEPAQRRPGTAAAVAGALVALLAVTLLVGRLTGFDLDLPDVDPPRWLRWLGPALGIGKLVFLIGLGSLAVIGEWERRRRKGGGPS
jgi:hypothetical protein